MKRALPVPTPRLVGMLALGVLPLLIGIGFPPARSWGWAWDGLCFVLAAWDGWRAPSPKRLRVTRDVPAVFSAGAPQTVTLRLSFPGRVAVRGELRDLAPVGMEVDAPRQRFRLAADDADVSLSYRITSSRRGSFHFGDAHARLEGPFGLLARQGRIPLAQEVKVYPDLTALSRDSLALARASEEWAKRPLRRAGGGSEFESLRPWAYGDDARRIDWKATARRGHPIVRVHQPERNQSVMLLLDCGRHMAGLLRGRRKLDHAVDAALRVARVALDAGDAVGLVAFGPTLITHLAPRRGREQLRALTQALYRVEAQLAESDYGLALDRAFQRHARRSLVVVLTDLLDRETSATLVKRTLALLPRHLPVLVSLLDEELTAAAHGEPSGVHEAYVRHVAGGLDEEYRLNASRLRSHGARVVRAPPHALGAAAVSEYLDVKSQGLL